MDTSPDTVLQPMSQRSSAAIVRKYPRTALAVLVILASLILDLGLTAVYHLIKYGTVRRSSARPSEIRVPSQEFHHTFKPNAQSDREGWGPLHPMVYTNSLGFKDSANRQVPLHSDRFRILFMGDSFTEGIGYDYADTFVGRLAAALAPRNIEVLNAGVVGYSPAIYWKKTEYLLETTGLRFDLMVVCLDVSDIVDEMKSYEIRGDRTVLAPESSSPILTFFKEYSTVPRHLIKLQDIAGKMLRDPTYRLTKSLERTPEDQRYGTRQDRSLWTIDPSLFEAYGRPGLARARRHMDLLSDLLNRNHIPLVLVIYPWPDQIIHRDLDSIHVRFWRDWATARTIPFVNLFPDFIKDGEEPYRTIADYYIPGDTHWNERGHTVVAARLQEFLQSIVDAKRPHT